MKKRFFRSKKDITREITPEQYADFMEAIDVDEIRTLGFKAYIRRDALMDSEDPSMDISDNLKINHTEEFTSAGVEFTFSLKSEKEKEPVLNISASYEVIILTEEDFPDEFWELYRTITLPSLVWPYFREFVQSTTNRMNVPAFTLPVVY